MLPGNYTPKPLEKLPLSNSAWDTRSAESPRGGGYVTALLCLGEQPPRSGDGAPSRGPSTLFLAAAHFGVGRKGGKHQVPQHLQFPALIPHHRAILLLHRALGTLHPAQPPRGDAAPSSSAHNDAEQSARGCARDDRLCTDVHYMIIIIILPRIHDERGGYDSYKEALVSRSCSRFFPLSPARPSPVPRMLLALLGPCHCVEGNLG